MNTRQSGLKAIRPEISSATINDMMCSDERFQNLVIRPIIKLQNDSKFIGLKQAYDGNC